MSDSSEENKQEKVTEELTKNVVTWVKLDDQIRENRAQTKILLDEKKQYEQFILDFLEHTNEKVLEISDGRLRRNVSKTKAPLKKETIFNSLKEITKDEEKSLKLTEYIINNRAMVERSKFKRTRNRGSRKKD